MIKRIEQYLLTNYPVIWNLKLVRVGLLVLLLHIVCFVAGYALTNPTPQDSYFSGTYTLLYAGAILAVILIFIFWLIQYNKHNGLKAFYPRSNISLYGEWLFIFAFCAFIVFAPNSMAFGREAKWKAAVSKKEWEEATKILARVQTLLPHEEYYFSLMGSSTPPLMVGNANVDRTRFDTRLYTYEEDAQKPDNPIEYIGPSLLYHRYSADENETYKVHQWLIEEKRDSIENTIQAFLDLHKKNNLETNVDADTWMGIIYHPPLYPVSEGHLIRSSSNSYSSGNKKYTQFDKLERHYETAGQSYSDSKAKPWSLLIHLIAAMGISVMVFSARITSGRSWIFALLSLGVLGFIYSLFLGFIGLIGIESMFGFAISAYWLGLLIALGILIAIKVIKGERKGYSNIYVNLFIWFIPAIIPWLFQVYLFIFDTTDGPSHPEDLFFSVCLTDVLFTLIIMFPVVMLLKKWKAVPED